MRSLVLLFGFIAAAPALAQRLAIASPNPERDGCFGCSLAGVPDTDGDGVWDFVVGANQEGSGDNSEGRAYLFSGATGAHLHTMTSSSAGPAQCYGCSVAGVPDVDGDGRGEILIGASEEAYEGMTDAGRVYLYSGATGQLIRAFFSPNVEAYGRFGTSVSGVADADGDGRGDLFVGASNEDGGAFLDGQAYLFSGATGDLLHTLVSPNDGIGGDFGCSVAGIEDADGDGTADLLVGAFAEHAGAIKDGRAYLFSGATGELLHTFESPNSERGGFFGYTVAGVPDVDGDVRGDLLIGAINEDYGGVIDAGRAYLYSGAAGVLLYAVTPPEARMFQFGFSVTGVPDTNGDGRGDFGIGAYSKGRYRPRSVRAYLYSGATGAINRPFESPNPEDVGYGRAVAGLPDVNGDGRGDGVIGATSEDGGGVLNSGVVYFYRTRGAEGGWEDAEEAAVAGASSSEAMTIPTLTVAPSPFTSSMAVRLALLHSAAVVVEVLDVLGRRVALVHEGALAAGAHELRWVPGHDIASGVYVVRVLGAGEPALVHRVTLAR
jgi:hypothetical protein